MSASCLYKEESLSACFSCIFLARPQKPPNRAPNGLGFTRPNPAQPGPARLRVTHGPVFFQTKTHGLGWAEF